mmetsp:Transcript_10948/g.21665  ORF Transcript_10948/g.21665 Transcript_10948/m.21665 type:complete len:620 (+) Transcript_10948:246-2105(+)
MVRPEEPRKETEQSTGDEDQGRHDRKHHANHNDQHILGQNFMERKPPRVIDRPHAEQHGSFLSQGRVRTEQGAHRSLQQAHDPDELHSEAEEGLERHVGDEEGGHFGEGSPEVFQRQLRSGYNDGHRVENGTGDSGDQKHIDDLKQKVPRKDLHLHLAEGENALGLEDLNKQGGQDLLDRHQRQRLDHRDRGREERRCLVQLAQPGRKGHQRLLAQHHRHKRDGHDVKENEHVHKDIREVPARPFGPLADVNVLPENIPGLRRRLHLHRPRFAAVHTLDGDGAGREGPHDDKGLVAHFVGVLLERLPRRGAAGVLHEGRHHLTAHHARIFLEGRGRNLHHDGPDGTVRAGAAVGPPRVLHRGRRRAPHLRQFVAQIRNGGRRCIACCAPRSRALEERGTRHRQRPVGVPWCPGAGRQRRGMTRDILTGTAPGLMLPDEGVREYVVNVGRTGPGLHPVELPHDPAAADHFAPDGNVELFQLLVGRSEALLCRVDAVEFLAQKGGAEDLRRLLEDVESDELALLRPAQLEELLFDLGDDVFAFVHERLEADEVLADRHRLDGLRIDVSEIIRNLGWCAHVTGDVGDQDGTEVRLTGQEIPVADVIEGIVFHEKLPDHNTRE